MGRIFELVRRLPDLNKRELEQLAVELEHVMGLASKDLPTMPSQPTTPQSNPNYFRLSGETNNAPLWSGADIILYSDSGTTETGRWDGATGNITLSGTVDGVDLANFNAGQFVVLSASGYMANERVLTGTANQITVTDGGAGSAVTLSTPQDIHTGASPTFAGLTLNGALALDGDLNFQGPQTITTTSGDLTLDSNSGVTLLPDTPTEPKSRGQQGICGPGGHFAWRGLLHVRRRRRHGVQDMLP